MLLYRVDKRMFKAGDTILPTEEYTSKMNEEVEQVEGVLNEYRKTSVPERNKCLFLFYNLSSAMLFWSKYSGVIYEVKPGKIYHKGDMNKLDNILDVFKTTTDTETRRLIVSEYWKDGTHVFQPCFEILVDKAIVERIIVEEHELCSFQRQLSELSYSVERTKLFKQLQALL